MQYPEGCSSFQETARWLTERAYPSAEDIGHKAPSCWDASWLAAEELYRFASCYDSCPGPEGDHTIRLLVGRMTNQVIGALDCMERGHYDNALIVCRVLLEQHNVLALLLHDNDALSVFKRSEGPEIRKELAPHIVRKKLKALDLDDIIIKEVNKLLQEFNVRAIHPALTQLTASHMPGELIGLSAFEVGVSGVRVRG